MSQNVIKKSDGTQNRTDNKSSLREEARRAKRRIKTGFWEDCQKDMDKQKEKAAAQGLNQSKAGRYFAAQVTAQIEGKTEDAFYTKVKQMLLAEGEVSDAIGRLTDKAYYATLSYEEKQRYTLNLSEKYLRALEKFRAEIEFSSL